MGINKKDMDADALSNIIFIAVVFIVSTMIVGLVLMLILSLGYSVPDVCHIGNSIWLSGDLCL